MFGTCPTLWKTRTPSKNIETRHGLIYPSPNLIFSHSSLGELLSGSTSWNGFWTRSFPADWSQFVIHWPFSLKQIHYRLPLPCNQSFVYAFSFIFGPLAFFFFNFLIAIKEQFSSLLSAKWAVTETWKQRKSVTSGLFFGHPRDMLPPVTSDRSPQNWSVWKCDL